MSLFTDIKYVGMISPRLERFKRKSEYLWNFRCPICGDSAKNKFKARGYIYRKKDDLFFACHNNPEDNSSLGNLIKRLDAHLYKQYIMEKYKQGSQTKNPDLSMVRKKPEFDTQISLPKIESLDKKHPAKKYLLGRKIPVETLNELYYTDNFKEFTDKIFPNHGKENLLENPAIIIPLYDDKKKLLGYQGRTLDGSSGRYITIKLNDDYIKGYGLNKITTSKPIYVFEGVFDAIFIPNSIATLDSALYKIIERFGIHDYIFVPDNEPRNKDIVKVAERIIKLNQKICIWPSNIKQKDVNDMINEGGYSPSEIHHIIDTNTFSGPRAQLELIRWKKT